MYCSIGGGLLGFLSFVQQILYCVPSLAEKAVLSQFFKKMDVWGISHFKKTFSFAQLGSGVKWQFFWAGWKITPDPLSAVEQAILVMEFPLY